MFIDLNYFCYAQRHFKLSQNKNQALKSQGQVLLLDIFWLQSNALLQNLGSAIFTHL